MADEFQFNISKYLGVWYELMHYPSWFQRNDNYNTRAEYMLTTDGNIIVHNSTIARGKEFHSYGTVVQLDNYELRVDFAPQEVSKLALTQEFNPSVADLMMDRSKPNYVINKLWLNAQGDYIYAVVTDPKKETLYVLSRYKHPSLIAYNAIMEYVVDNYDRDRLVQTPHFD